MNTEDDVGFVFELLQQTHFHIWIEVGQHPGCVVIEDKLAPELQVEFVVELADAVENLGRLLGQVFVHIKHRCSVGHHGCWNLHFVEEWMNGSPSGSP